LSPLEEFVFFGDLMKGNAIFAALFSF